MQKLLYLYTNLPCDDVLYKQPQRHHGPAYPWNYIHNHQQYSLLHMEITK